MNARSGHPQNVSFRISQTDMASRRCQIFPADVVASSSFSDFPNPTGENVTAFSNGFTVFILRDHPPIRLAIFLRKLGKLRASPVQIAPLRQITAVGKRHVKHRVGINVFQAVVA